MKRNGTRFRFGVLAGLLALPGCIESQSGSTPANVPLATADSAPVVEPKKSPEPSEPKNAASPATEVALAAIPDPPSASTPKPATPSPTNNDKTTPSTVVSETRIRTPAKSKSAAGLAEITFDDIKFDMKEKEDPFKREMLTPAIEALVGKKVRLRGYILPSFQQQGLTQFVLMRDNMECCFGPGAWIYDCVIVEMKPGTSADFSVRPVAVDGIFEVSEFLDADGKHLAVYRIVGEKVKQ